MISAGLSTFCVERSASAHIHMLGMLYISLRSRLTTHILPHPSALIHVTETENRTKKLETIPLLSPKGLSEVKTVLFVQD